MKKRAANRDLGHGMTMTDGTELVASWLLSITRWTVSVSPLAKDPAAGRDMVMDHCWTIAPTLVHTLQCLSVSLSSA